MPLSTLKDSLTVSLNRDSLTTPSIFSDHELRVKNDDSLIHLTSYDYIVALVLFISFCAFVWLYVSNRKRLGQLLKSFYISRLGNQASRDDYSFSGRVGFLLSLLFLLTMPLFLGQVLEYTGHNLKLSTPALYLWMIAGLVAMYLVKFIVIRFSGFVFKTGKEAQDYSSAMFVFINLLGLIMLPVVICLEFVKHVNPVVFIYTGAFLIIGFLCMRLLRGIVIGVRSNRVSKFYLFLYLCTLEIVPFVILVKLFMLYIA